MLLRKRNGIFGNHSLPGGGVRSDEDGVPHLKMEHGLLLERVKLEGVLRRMWVSVRRS